MNRKGLLCFILFLFLLAGCQQKEKPSALAILSLEEQDKGIVLLLDEKYQTIDSFECLFPYVYYYNDGTIYISDDGSNYQGYSLQTKKETTVLKEIIGDIMSFNSNDDYISYYNGGICCFKNDEETCVQKYPMAYTTYQDYFYIVDSDSIVNVYEANSLNLVTSFSCKCDGFAGFTIIDDILYLVSNSGVSKIVDNKIELTYFYRQSFDEVIACKGNRISVFDDNEIVIYQLSFDKYSMNMTLELEEKYYQEIDVDAWFSEYIEQGYEFLTIIEVNEDD